MVTTPCVCNALRRASEKPLRTAVTEVGFFEGTGVVAVEFNSWKVLDQQLLVKSSLRTPS
jgi:hypothetical protein